MRRPLRIGLIMSGGYIWMGGVEYIKNIVFALASLRPEVRSSFEICLVCNNQLSHVAAELSTYLNNVYYLETSLEPLTPANRIRWRIDKTFVNQYDLRYNQFLEKARIDFVYPYLVKGAGKKSYRWAAWIPDCQHKYLPEFFPKEEIISRDTSFSTIANHAPVVVFSSKAAQADFLKFFFRATYKPEILSPSVYPLQAWYELDPLKTQRTYHLPDRFFLMNNQFWQHKNHQIVFEALRILKNRSVYPVVVCTGSLYDYRNPSFIDTLLQTINKLDIAHQVYILGMTTRLDMIALMRRCLAVIHPSLFEGWSTVVEEARCMGKTIILSNIPVHQEQDPPHGIFFNKDSAEGLASVLADSWNELAPGPDSKREATARETNLRHTTAFGYRFLEIAKG